MATLKENFYKNRGLSVNPLKESIEMGLPEGKYDDFDDGIKTPEKSAKSLESLPSEMQFHIPYDDGRGGGKDFLPFKVGHLKAAKKNAALKNKILTYLSKETPDTPVLVSRQTPGSQMVGDEESLWSGTIGDLMAVLSK